jgi:hypothetical protein
MRVSGRDLLQWLGSAMPKPTPRQTPEEPPECSEQQRVRNPEIRGDAAFKIRIVIDFRDLTGMYRAVRLHVQDESREENQGGRE